MDVSHINLVLGYFEKSLVSVPIKTNAFEEVYSDDVKQSDTTSALQKFDMLDDILFECRNFRKHASDNDTHKSKLTTISHDNIKHCQHHEHSKESYVDELYYTISCVKDPLLTLKGFDKSVTTKMKHDMISYLDNTQVKVLDMAKYKYTKKGLRELLTVDCKASDVLEWNIVRAIVVLAVRYLKKPVTIQIQGETKEHIPLPSSMTQEQGPSSTTQEQGPSSSTLMHAGGIINYENGRFVML